MRSPCCKASDGDRLEGARLAGAGGAAIADDVEPKGFQRGE